MPFPCAPLLGTFTEDELEQAMHTGLAFLNLRRPVIVSDEDRAEIHARLMQMVGWPKIPENLRRIADIIEDKP